MPPIKRPVSWSDIRRSLPFAALLLFALGCTGALQPADAPLGIAEPDAEVADAGPVDESPGKEAPPATEAEPSADEAAAEEEPNLQGPEAVEAEPEAVEADPEEKAGPSLPVSFPAPNDDWIVQIGSNLWTLDGTWLVEFGGLEDGASPFADGVYLIDARQDAFFVLAEEGVHVARRSGDQFVIHRVRDDVRATWPLGRIAMVRTAEKKAAFVDLNGDMVRDGVRLGPSLGVIAIPLTLPEYWWSHDFLQRPFLGCTSEECGFFGQDGEFLWKSTQEREPFMYMPTTFTTGGALVDSEKGELWPESEDRRYMGPGSEGLVLVGIPEDGDESTRPTRFKTEIRGFDGEVRAVVDAEVRWTPLGCPHLYEDISCRYVFHEGRALVYVEGFKYGYLKPDGSFAIEPEAKCEGYLMSGPFHEERALHCVGEDLWLIDRDGNRIGGPWPVKYWEPSYGSISGYPNGPYFSDGLAAIMVGEGEWAYIDRSGEVVLPGPYATAQPFRLGFARVRSRGARLGYFIDKTGKEIFTVPVGEDE